MYKLTFFIVFIFHFSVTQAKVKVVTSIPDLAQVVRAIGGELVDVDSLLDGTEDPHFLDATPRFIKKVAKADIVCLVGMELEIGWAPRVLQKSANVKVQPGGIGYCLAGSKVEVLDKPTTPVDRSMGDVHPSGNPHYNLSPKQLIKASEVVTKHLVQADPINTKIYIRGQKNFEKNMNDLHSRIKKKLAEAMGGQKTNNKLMEYHREFTYFFKTYGLSSNTTIEKLPGVPPSARRLAEVALQAQSSKVKLALGSFYAPEKHLKKFTEISQIPYKKLPTMVQKNNKKLDTIEEVQDHLASVIAESLKL